MFTFFFLQASIVQAWPQFDFIVEYLEIHLIQWRYQFLNRWQKWKTM